MKTLKINSSKYGLINVLLDDEDFERIEKDYKNLKWAGTKNRNK